ncbi:MAG: mechanosensitive ion channel family protein [Thermoanaerobaculales bacterium]|jgi:small-conductance mechanosensitive channel|nr:mechanosensitive ion channel family protein [Thermoanaerobaculales bacterium]
MTDQLETGFDWLSSTLGDWPVLGTVIAGNPGWRWLLASVFGIVFALLLRFVTGRIADRLDRFAGKTRSSADDILVGVVRSTTKLFFGVVGVLVAAYLVELQGTAADVRRFTAVIAVTVQIGVWGQRAVSLWLEDQRERLSETDPGAITTFQGLSYLVRGALWVAVVVFILDNLGYNVSALLAGLGIGGVAVALALQNVLGDLFASLSIALDKPFVTGDFIIVDDKLGTVSRIGLKTTRVVSLSGEQLVFSNSDLLSSRIRNYKKMRERRVVFSFGVLYQTTPQQLEAIPPMVRAIIEDTPETRFDRAHFKEFGDSAYLFEVVYYVLQPDYNVYMDCQQHINLELCRRFEEHGIDFAFPTRTLHLETHTGPALVSCEPRASSADRERLNDDQPKEDHEERVS